MIDKLAVTRAMTEGCAGVIWTSVDGTFAVKPREFSLNPYLGDHFLDACLRESGVERRRAAEIPRPMRRETTSFLRAIGESA